MLRGIGGAGMRLFVSALVSWLFCRRIGGNRTNTKTGGACSRLRTGAGDDDARSAGHADVPQSQAGCPVVLTSARLNWPASYLPVTSAEKVTAPNLALRFQNASGKEIRAVSHEGAVSCQESIYELDASDVRSAPDFLRGERRMRRRSNYGRSGCRRRCMPTG